MFKNACRPAALYRLSVDTVVKAYEKVPREDEEGVKYYSIASTTDKNFATTRRKSVELKLTHVVVMSELLDKYPSISEPTFLSIDEKLMDLLLNFIKFVRPCMVDRVGDKDLKDVFLTRSGDPMEDSLVSTAWR